MLIERLQLKNWLNFRNVDVPLGPRTTLIGANASGKSNFMEVFRFLRTVAQKEGGGLQQAVKDRNGLAKLRSLHARSDPKLKVDVELLDDTTTPPTRWRYVLVLRSEGKGQQRALVAEERVERDSQTLFARPSPADQDDPERLTQTHLEQINLNRDFRAIADYFAATTYLHLVPQLLKHGDAITSRPMENDPFGQGLLQRIAATPKRARESRISRIRHALSQAIPLLSDLRFEQDHATGRWHLEAQFEHWRSQAWHREDQFSDGTLRLIGILWALQDGDGLLLLEEPELSLNSEIVRHIPLLVDRVLRDRRKGGIVRQVLVSTHSESLLAEIDDPSHVLLIEPSSNGSEIRPPSATELESMRHGLNAAEVLLPKTRANALENFGLTA